MWVLTWFNLSKNIVANFYKYNFCYISSCHAGWAGVNCSKCQPRVDCKYGTCADHPFECKCFSKYNGTACDKPVCKEGCHPENVRSN